METVAPLPLRVLQTYPMPDKAVVASLLQEELARLDKKIIALDDDPTGSQTVHDIPLFTTWDEATFAAGFAEATSLFFVMTNSRGLTVPQTTRLHREAATALARVMKRTGRDAVVISRSDSTLRGHYPLETEVLREELENATGQRFDGEIIYPFFREGGRYTIDDIHYVKDGDMLIPAGMTEFARDKSFGYKASSLPEWCEEKTGGRYRAGDVTSITLDELRSLDIDAIEAKLMAVRDFNKVIVNSIDTVDVRVFVTALCRALRRGKRFLVRSAAAIVKELGGVDDIPLLDHDTLVDPANTNGGIVIVGSHIHKTTMQLEELRRSALPLEFMEFNAHRFAEKGGLEDEAKTIAARAEAFLREGKNVVIYTSRTLLSLDTRDKDKILEASIAVSSAVTGIVRRLAVRPRFIVGKGGITSSDVATLGLGIKRAQIMGQIRQGVPVWRTGKESRFPGMPYVIFPGNVGDTSTLREALEILIGEGA